MPSWSRVSLLVVVFACGYLLLQEVGLWLAFGPAGLAAFWPAAGLGVAAFAYCRRARWLLLGVVLLLVNVSGNVMGGNSLLVSACLALVNTGEAVLGGLLLARSGGSGESMPARWVLRALLPVAAFAAAAAGLAGATVVTALGNSEAGFGLTWWAWFSADLLGIVVMVPAARAVFAGRPSWTSSASRVLELCVLLALQACVVRFVFTPVVDGLKAWQWPYLLLPGLFWSAVRFGPQVTAMMSALLTTSVILGTANGGGPFAQARTVEDQMLSAQGFCAVIFMSALMMSKVIASHEALEVRLGEQSAVLELAVEGIAYIDPTGCYLRINHAYAATLGTTAEYMLGRSWEPTVHPEDLSSLRTAYAYMLEHGSVTAEARGIRTDGTVFHKEITMIADRAADGALLGHHCFMRDITARKAATEHVDQLFRLSPELLCVIDAEGRFARLNPAWSQTLGYPVADMIGRPFIGFVHPDDVEATAAEAAEIAGGTESIAFENRYRHSDGSHRWLRWNSAVDTATGTLYAVAHDVTGSKNTEQNLADARDQAMEASRMKSQFLAMMSHEIRTPMNGVIGLTDLLADTHLDAVQQKYVDGVRGAGNALLAVINDILDFSKIEAGKFVLDDADFRLPAVIADVAILTGQSAKTRGLTLVTDLHPELPAVVRGDPGRVRQILLNLIGNAVKFTHEGTVTIRAYPHDLGTKAAVRVEVADTGIGMNPAAVTRMFQPFTQADASTTRTYGGTGLGLAISRQLAEAMGGDITVTSAENAGTTFTVTLPLPAVNSADITEAADPSRLRVLIVDDNATNQLTLADQVRSWGMRADIADSADQAEQLLLRSVAHERHYDIAIVDMHIPGMSGLQLATGITANPAIPTVPIILMTSGEAINSFEARRAGIGAHLTKPVSRSDLYDALTTAIRPAPDTEPAVTRGHLLLVEDNETNQMVATGILTKLGYTIDIANDGLEALELAAKSTYQAILMDCQMPNMDGYTAARKIRESPKVARIPIIALTANAFKDERDRCLTAGMDDYLPKPIRAHDLDATLTRWTATAPVTHPTPQQTTSRHDTLMAERLEELIGDHTPTDIAFIQKIIGSFITRAPAMITAIGVALTDNDPPAVAYHAHALKSSATNLGAHAIAETCAVIEDLARTGDINGPRRHHARLAALLDRTTNELTDTLNTLNTLTEHHTPAKPH
ncbi:response regulator [Actinoplanes derwentensis]|uniref:response regulator n=1 Tax=Actinoplanes derwentensis TaxID=113562 RepID=UPI0015607C47|nr:response regulator [Actinoplanes derwentensis]